MYEFHCANYHGIMEVISGLRTTIGHLIKEVKCDVFTINCTTIGDLFCLLIVIYGCK